MRPGQLGRAEMRAVGTKRRLDADRRAHSSGWCSIMNAVWMEASEASGELEDQVPGAGIVAVWEEPAPSGEQSRAAGMGAPGAVAVDHRGRMG